MNCPLCRKEFIIPREGLSGMQKNFLMEKLLHIRKLSCEQHQVEEIRMYCQQCKVAVCVVCFTESHNTHQCLDIKKMSDECT